MLLDRLLYEYRRVGYVEKDGKRCAKYQKVPRLRSRHRRAAVAVLLALFAALSAALLLSGKLASTAPSFAERTLPADAGPGGN